MNVATLVGNLGADPELRQTQSGRSVLRMRLATSERFQDRDGQRQERTDWHTVVLWGKRAEALAKILSKGRKIGVTGRVQTSSYEKDGQTRHSTEINAQDVEILDSRRDSESFGPGENPYED